MDAGKSGLSLNGREAQKKLLSDVLAAQRAFDAILVLDVSRWGRFQNPDQAAHYEFLCRQAGVRVVYCGEPFGDDVAPITTIIKHLKRVMAGEYSRELSAKMSRAHRQQAELGFRQGGKLIYGFRRLLVDSARNPKQILNLGERKAINSDKVIVIPGPPAEVAVVRRIFRLYVRHRLPLTVIAERLAKRGVRRYEGRSLDTAALKKILSCELCIGQMTYNRTAKRLQARPLKNPEHSWTRFAAFQPIVSQEQFRKAQALLSQSADRFWKREGVTEFLKKLVAQKVRITGRSISQTEGAPSSATITRHFGSLTAAYAAVGYTRRPRLTACGKQWTKDRILAGLHKLQSKSGYISDRLIDSARDLPSSLISGATSAPSLKS
jgi:DNA invertase Pin-like site-specific DNA recombinase